MDRAHGRLEQRREDALQCGRQLAEGGLLLVHVHRLGGQQRHPLEQLERLLELDLAHSVHVARLS